MKEHCPHLLHIFADILFAGKVVEGCFSQTMPVCMAYLADLCLPDLVLLRLDPLPDLRLEVCILEMRLINHSATRQHPRKLNCARAI